MSISLKLAITPSPEDTVTAVRIEGDFAGLGKLTANSIVIDSNFSLRIIGTIADTRLPAMTKLFNPMTINWSISTDNKVCNMDCASAGSSDVKVFVTLGTPTVTPVYLTVLDLAVSNDGAATQADAFQKTWAKFAGPADVKNWQGLPLYYYRNNHDDTGPIGFDSCATSPVAWPGHLLTNIYYSGQCGAFVRLFLRALATNGIQVDLGPFYTPNPSAQAVWTQVNPADGSEMLVKDWGFAASPTYPLGSPYVTDGWSMALPHPGEMVPFPFPDPNDYGDLTNCPRSRARTADLRLKRSSPIIS
jgi:hypothetical protein